MQTAMDTFHEGKLRVWDVDEETFYWCCSWRLSNTGERWAS